MAKLVIVGHKGQLGRMLYSFPTGLEHVGLDLPEFDMTDAMAVMDVLGTLQPQVVINAAGYTNVDRAETEPDLTYAVNAHAVGHLARACHRLGVPLVHVSSNEVFDGTASLPYDEWDQPHPASAYARSKLAGETAARYFHDLVLIVRTAWLFGPGGNNFPSKIIAGADKHGQLRVVGDEFGNPTYAPDLAAGILALVGRSVPAGIYHLTNTGFASRYEFACEVLRQSGRSDIPVTPVAHTEWPRPSQPPLRAVLANRSAAAYGVALPPWQEAVANWVEHERMEGRL